MKLKEEKSSILLERITEIEEKAKTLKICKLKS